MTDVKSDRRFIDTAIGDIKIRYFIGNIAEDREPDCAMPQSHFFDEIIFIVSGTVIIDTLSGKYILPQNSICFIPSMTPYIFQLSSKNTHYIAIALSCAQIPGSPSLYTIYEKIRVNAGITVFNNCSYLRNIFINYGDIRLSQDVLYDPYIKAFVSVIVLNILRQSSPNIGRFPLTAGNDNIPQREYMIETYITRNFTSDIKISDMAVVLNLSVRQTCRIIKKIFGTTFKEMLSELRLLNARSILESSKIPVHEISDCLGFPSQRALNSAFRRKYGVSPSEYRNRKIIADPSRKNRAHRL